MSRSKSSRRWLKEHHSDDFVIKSRQQNWRSRAVYKLAEIDQRDNLVKGNSCVIELGAAPGGWTQYVAGKLTAAGLLVAIDILPIEPIADAVVIQADLTESEALFEIERALGGRKADLVLSDMAPNFTGHSAVDQPRSMYLAELALDMCSEFLSPGGALLVKTFQGVGFEALNRNMREQFDSVKSRKPAASRARSREVYLLARGRKPL